MGEAAPAGAKEPAIDRAALFALLTPWQRFAVRFAALFHRRPLVWFAQFWHWFFVEHMLMFFILRRLDVSGLERLRGISLERPVLVVSNHRTYTDLFVVFYVLRRRLKLRHPICFPVRSNFFYENPLGLFMCTLFSACAMYPPIFRAGRARAFNAYSLELLTEELRTPKRMVGFHPEGTRSKSESPYEMLPAKRGAGEMALNARPIVVPVFISGLKNAPLGELADNFRFPPRRRVRLNVGAELDLSRWPKSEGRVANADAQACAEAMMEAIQALAAEQRAAISQASAD